MKLGILSDSHGSKACIDAAISQAGPVDGWVHAGDCCPDAEYLSLCTDLPVYKVRGNCDSLGETAKDLCQFSIAGHSLLVVHGHLQNVDFGTKSLWQMGAEAGADLVIYGHTHRVRVEPGHPLILNPGSIARPRDSAAGSFLVVELLPDQDPVVQVFRLESSL